MCFSRTPTTEPKSQSVARFSGRKTCAGEARATQPRWRSSCTSAALTPDRTNCLSAAQTSSRTVVQSPTFTCRNRLAVGYRGVSSRSSNHRLPLFGPPNTSLERTAAPQGPLSSKAHQIGHSMGGCNAAMPLFTKKHENELRRSCARQISGDSGSLEPSVPTG